MFGIQTMPVMQRQPDLDQSAISHTRASQMDEAAQAWLLRAEKAKAVAASLRAQLSCETEEKPEGNIGVQYTTVIVRNIPVEYSRQMFLDLLDSRGFAGAYDFVYLPRDFQRSLGLGYAFVNLLSCEDAMRLQDQFNGFCEWKISSQKICQVGPSNRQQGLKEQIKRYQNSSLMHRDVPDEYKPALFKNGIRIPFPAPTQELMLPHGFRVLGNW